MAPVGSKKALWTTLITLSALTGLCACSVARMQRPQSLQGPEVKGLPIVLNQGVIKDDKVSFGAWKTTRVKRGWITSSRLTVAGLSGGEGSQHWQFTLEGAGHKITANCLTTRKISGFSFFGFRFGEERVVFVCDISDSTAIIGQIAMGMKRRGRSGMIHWRDKLILIRSEHKVQGSQAKLFDPLGYSFIEKGRAIAAAQLLNDRQLWLAPGLNADAVVAVAAGVVARVLVQDITPHDER